MGERQDDEYLYSDAISGIANTTFGIGTNLTWDAFQRQVYEQVTTALQQQANALARRGNITYEEAKHLVEAQRNGLVLEMRKKLSPMGRMYSEILKPSNSLPTLDSLIQKKGTVEAVVRSVGKSRASVNRFTAIVRRAGPASILLQVTVSGIIIASANEEDRARVAAGQAGAIGGSTLGGWGGAWAGCAALSAIWSPSLVVPLWGEVTVGGACLVGGIAGGFGGGWVGGYLGENAGGLAYDFVSSVEWVSE